LQTADAGFTRIDSMRGTGPVTIASEDAVSERMGNIGALERQR
jgi:hypothetical protein